jgi:hypothetical protein
LNFETARGDAGMKTFLASRRTRPMTSIFPDAE